MDSRPTTFFHGVEIVDFGTGIQISDVQDLKQRHGCRQEVGVGAAEQLARRERIICP